MSELFSNINGALVPRYPNVPGFKAQETSKQAATEMNEKASGLQLDCLMILNHGERTADEIASRLNKSILAIRPRLSELLRKGKIEDSGERRPNASGKMAIVWKLK